MVPLQTIPGQPSKVRAIDEELRSEVHFAKDLVMVDRIKNSSGLGPIGTKECWAMDPIDRIKTTKDKFRRSWLGEEPPQDTMNKAMKADIAVPVLRQLDAWRSRRKRSAKSGGETYIVRNYS